MLIINYQISHLNKIKKKEKKKEKKNHIVLNFLMGYNPIIKNKIKNQLKIIIMRTDGCTPVLNTRSSPNSNIMGQVLSLFILPNLP